jgi:hypothetical protein
VSNSTYTLYPSPREHVSRCLTVPTLSTLALGPFLQLFLTLPTIWSRALLLQSSDDPLFSETIHNLKKTGGLYEVPQNKRWVTYSQPVYDTGFVSTVRDIIISLYLYFPCWLWEHFSRCLTVPTLSTLALGPFFQVSNSTYTLYPGPETIFTGV